MTDNKWRDRCGAASKMNTVWSHSDVYRRAMKTECREFRRGTESKTYPNEKKILQNVFLKGYFSIEKTTRSDSIRVDYRAE